MSYKTTCPNCGKGNFYVTEENGMKYCFNCTYVEKDGAIEQTKVRSEHIDSIRNYYNELVEYYHSCLDTEHVTFLHNRGITDDTIQRLKIGYCPNSAHVLYTHPLAKESGMSIKNEPFLADRIVFPYWFDNQVTDIRGRSLVLQGAEKYKSPFHSAYFRGADYAYNVKTISEKTIVVTEGEIKSILPEQHGLPTKGLPGMNANRMIAVAPFQKVVICFDNQRHKRADLIRAIKRLAQRIPNVFIATLPLRGKDKQDIDSYILSYGVDAYKQVIAAAMPYDRWRGYVYG